MCFIIGGDSDMNFRFLIGVVVGKFLVIYVILYGVNYFIYMGSVCVVEDYFMGWNCCWIFGLYDLMICMIDKMNWVLIGDGIGVFWG